MRHFLLMILIASSTLLFGQSSDELLTDIMWNAKFKNFFLKGRDASHRLFLIDTFSVFHPGFRGKFNDLELEVVNHDIDTSFKYKIFITGLAKEKKRIVIQFRNPMSGMSFEFYFDKVGKKYLFNKTTYGFI